MEGMTQLTIVNGLSCPTFAKRPIEFQCEFSRLSHRLSRLRWPVAAIGSSPMRQIKGHYLSRIARVYCDRTESGRIVAK